MSRRACVAFFGRPSLGSGETVYYFIISTDGDRYGPADIDTLVKWVHEGRIVATTILIERGTEKELRADSLTAVAAALRQARGDTAGVAVERDVPVQGELQTATAAPDRGVADPKPPPVPPAAQVVPPPSPYTRPESVGPRSKVVAGLLGIFLGWLGVHRFYLGYTGIGLLMLLLSVFGGAASFACIPGSGCGIVGLWGLIEGIICLTGGMRDADGLELRD